MPKFIKDGTKITKENFKKALKEFEDSAKKPDPLNATTRDLLQADIEREDARIVYRGIMRRIWDSLSKEEKKNLAREMGQVSNTTLKKHKYNLSSTLYRLDIRNNNKFVDEIKAQATFRDALDSMKRYLTKNERDEITNTQINKVAQKLEANNRQVANKIRSKAKTLDDAFEIAGNLITAQDKALIVTEAKNELANKLITPLTSEQEYKNLINRVQTTNDSAELEGIANQYLTEAERNSLKSVTEDYITSDELEQNFTKVLDAVLEKLSDVPQDGQKSELEQLAEDLDKIKAPMEKESEKMYAEEINILQNKIEWKDIDAEKKTEYKRTLDEVNAILTTLTDNNYGSYLTDRQVKNMKAGDKEAEDAVREVFEKEGLKNSEEVLLARRNDDSGIKEVLNENDFNNLKNTEMKFSEQTKEHIKVIFAKMEQFDMAPDGSMLGQKDQLHALKGFVGSLEKFKDDLNKEDIEETVASAKEVKKKYEQTKEMLALIHEYFPETIDYNLVGEDLGLQNNSNLPRDIREDMKAVAVLNGLHVAYDFCKGRGIDIDDYLNSPIKYAKEFYKDVTAKNNKPENTIVGKSGTSAILDLMTVGSNKNKEYAVMRALDGLARVENNKEMREHNLGAEEAFGISVETPYNLMIKSRELFSKDVDNLDKFLIVGEKQKDLRLANVQIYDPEKGTLNNPKGYDEIEYISACGKSMEEWKNQFDRNLLDFYAMKKDDFKYGLSEKQFVEIAQRAAVKVLAVNRQYADEQAYQELQAFLTDGGRYINGIVEKAHRNGEYTSVRENPSQADHENKYAHTLDDFTPDRYRNLDGNSLFNTYWNAESAYTSYELKLEFLKEKFAAGEVTSRFYEERKNQLTNHNADIQNLMFFEKDARKTKDAYISEKYPSSENNPDYDPILSQEEKDMLYDAYLDSLERERCLFAAKKYLKEKGLVPANKAFSMKEMAEMYPDEDTVEAQNMKEIRTKANDLVNKFNERSKEEINAENNLPNETRRQFVRPGETITRDNFAEFAMRFAEFANRPLRKNEGESEVERAKRYEESELDKLRNNIYMKKILFAMPDEKIEKFAKYLPEKVQKTITMTQIKTLDQMLDKVEKGLIEKMKDAPTEKRKEEIRNKIEEISATRQDISENMRTLPIGEAKKKAEKYFTEEQKKNVLLSIKGGFSEKLLSENYPLLASFAAKEMPQKEFDKLVEDIKNYKVFGEKSRDEYGIETFKYVKEATKTQIDKAQTLNGQELTQERKNEIKAILDEASDFVREPQDENDFEKAFQIQQNYEKAILHDLTDAGPKRLQQENIDIDIIEERMEEPSREVLVLPKEGKDEEVKKMDKQDFKFSDHTKQALKDIFNKMHEYGYDQAGLQIEQGKKRYGMTKIAKCINNYKKAMKGDDLEEKVKASEELIREKARVKEMLDLVKEKFPVHKDNLSFPGNVDIVRNNEFPPEMRLDGFAISQFNGIYGTLNFVKSQNIDIDDFLEKPISYINKYFIETESCSLDTKLKGKSGAEALFEASRDSEYLPKMVLFSIGRMYESFSNFDIDPAIREHNAGLEKYFTTRIGSAIGQENADRRRAYGPNAQLDRFIFVDEPQQDARLVGVNLYNAQKLGLKEPEPFDDVKYLTTKEKTSQQWKEQFDNAILEYLRLEKENKVISKNGSTKTTQGYDKNKFLEIVQKAATKVLLARSLTEDLNAIKYDDDGNRIPNGYDDLKSLVYNGKEYVEKLVDSVKENERYKGLAENGLPTTTNNPYAAVLDGFDEYVVNYTIPDKLIQPDKDFNKVLKVYVEEIQGFDAIISSKRKELLKNHPDYRNVNAEDVDMENVNREGIDNEDIKVLQNEKNKKEQELNAKKAAEKERLEKAVENGTLARAYVDARKAQIDGNRYVEHLPTGLEALPNALPRIMSRDEYLATINQDLMRGFDEEDKNALYEVYRVNQETLIAQMKKPIIGNMILRAYMENNHLMPPQVIKENVAPQRVEQRVEQREEQREQKNYSANWFNANENITKDKLKEVVKAKEQNCEAQPVGNNWLEKRIDYEKKQNDIVRLQSLYDNAVQKLDRAGRQNVYNSLPNETQNALKVFSLQEIYRVAQSQGGEAATQARNLYENGFLGNQRPYETVRHELLNLIPQAQRNDPKFDHINQLANKAVYEKIVHEDKNMAVWDNIIDNLKEQDIEAIANAVNTNVSITEKPIEDFTATEFDKEIESIKNIAFDLQSYKGSEMNEDKRRQITETLEKANKITSKVDSEYADGLATVGKEREQGEYGMNQDRFNDAKDGFRQDQIEVVPGDLKGGKGEKDLIYAGIVKQKTEYVIEDSQRSFLQLGEGENAKEDFEKLKDYKIELKNNTKQNIKAVFEMFDRFEYDKNEFAAEEGEKKYAFWRYQKARDEFVQEAQSNDPSEKMKAIEKAELMNKEYDNVKELVGFVKEKFNVDGGTQYAGNLDLVRNEKIPPEFRKDIAGVSMLNGLYLAYRTIKQHNADIDEVLDNPSKFVIDEANKVIEKSDIRNAVKGKKGAEAIFEIGKEGVGMGYENGMSFSRTIETFAKLETDNELAIKNKKAEYAFATTTGMLLNNIVQRSHVLGAAEEHLDRMLLTDKPVEDISIMGVQTYNFKDAKLDPTPVPPFDEVEALKNNTENPEQFYTRIKRESLKALELIRQNKKDTQLIDEHIVMAMKKPRISIWLSKMRL